MNEPADRLRSIPGVSDVEWDLAAATIKVRLSEDADPRRVGEQVQAVLAGSGYRSRLAPPRREPAAPPFAGPGEAHSPSAPAPPAPASPRSGPARVDWVQVREATGAVVVAVSVGGKEVRRDGRPTTAGVQDALTEAVGAGLGVAAPRLRAVSEQQVGGARVVTVVVERPDGSMGVGAALVEVGVWLATARAIADALVANQ